MNVVRLGVRGFNFFSPRIEQIRSLVWTGLGRRGQVAWRSFEFRKAAAGGGYAVDVGHSSKLQLQVVQSSLRRQVDHVKKHRNRPRNKV